MPETRFQNIIDIYSREEAIADGVLIDVTADAQGIFACSVALTSAAAERTERGLAEAERKAALRNVLRAAASAYLRSSATTQVNFNILVGEGSAYFYVAVGPNEQGRPCATILLQGED